MAESPVVDVSASTPASPASMSEDLTSTDHVVSSSRLKGVLLPIPLPGPSDASHLPLVHLSAIPSTPSWVYEVAGCSGPVAGCSGPSRVVAPSGSPLRELEAKEVKKTLNQDYRSFADHRDPPPTLVPEPDSIDAKWEELLTLLEKGYGRLITDPNLELCARSLLQEVSLASGSLMGSKEFAARVDQFILGFVKALENVRQNTSHLPLVAQELQQRSGTQVVRTKCLEDLELYFSNYERGMIALHEAEQRRVDLEKQLEAAKAEELTRRARVDALKLQVRRKQQGVKEIEKELALTASRAKVLEKKHAEMTEENLHLEFELREFVIAARTLLYSSNE